GVVGTTSTAPCRAREQCADGYFTWRRGMNRHWYGLSRSRIVAVMLLTPMLFVAGCATLGRAAFREPIVSLREVAVTGLGFSGGHVNVVLSVYNPNSYNLGALGMTYQVDIDSVPLGSGQLGERFVVQQGDSSIVRLPISFTYAGIGAAG